MKYASRLIAIIALIFTASVASAQDVPPASPAPPVAAPVAQAPAAPAVPQAPAPVQPVAPAVAIVPRREDQPVVTPPVATGTPPRPSLLDRVKAFQHANGNAAQLLAQIQALTAERDQLTAQVGTLTSERDAARAELSQISAALDAQTNVVQATATQIATTVGIPQERLPAQIGPVSASAKEFQARLSAAKTPKEQAAVMAEFKKAIADGVLSPA